MLTFGYLSKGSSQSLFEKSIARSLLVTVEVMVFVFVGPVTVTVTKVVADTVVVTARGVTVVTGVEVTRAFLDRVRVRA